jgi:hypothetical protein
VVRGELIGGGVGPETLSRDSLRLSKDQIFEYQKFTLARQSNEKRLSVTDKFTLPSGGHGTTVGLESRPSFFQLSIAQWKFIQRLWFAFLRTALCALQVQLVRWSLLLCDYRPFKA